MPFPQRVVETRRDIPDVFQENTQNVLQKAAVSNMIGCLEQLNKISLYASEIFSDILATTESNNKRIKSVKQRLASIEQKVEPTEKMLLANSPAYFYDNPYTGKEWQRKDPLRGLLFRRDRADKNINRRREVGLPLPDLSVLDRFSASGECVKKFSDSNFFMNEWLEAEKKKMEEEKAKRKEKKKKRKKKKREGAAKITGIERWVYDPVTGKKIKKEATEITVTQYNLTDSNAAANLDFESADSGARQDRIKSVQTSKVAAMANQKKVQQEKAAAKKQKEYSNLSPDPSHQAGGPSYGGNIPGVDQLGGGPPPNPMAGGGGPPPNPMARGGPPPNPVVGGGGPPPNPVQDGAPPPNPMQGGPPPIPQPKQKLTAAEMAARSRMAAQETGAYASAVPPPVPAAQEKKAPLVPMASNALLAGIRGGVNLKKAEVKRAPPKLDGRDMLLAAIQKKAGSGLKKVAEEEKNVKHEEKVDNTIFAILNRRQYMADDSDSEGSGSWGSSDDD
eukprot:CAMPEP_0197020326 /NCGR_PEP_ID=MMETSP1384-20130603/1091_1 /TAXON_ID=29189 /ORGANISM="Ammonia sp." /LENGTH=504 /DNA_ID=CAMNT_0042447931 /DNA_START=30 /DNA_END=1544 /DNA_ORIENTATION=+